MLPAPSPTRTKLSANPQLVSAVGRNDRLISRIDVVEKYRPSAASNTAELLRRYRPVPK